MQSTARDTKRKIAVRKWGNGYGVLLPKLYVDTLGLKGADVQTTLKGTSIIVTKSRTLQKRVLTLKTMVRGMNKKNRHQLVDFGKPVGKEVW
ncbi:MAG: AbrB/MazE/SpoVT family DNA-binding domain-containing protein [bacterium]|nr:AbrB/MazE/SpoVT family DNA-binding domain-containing protein [bacterium]